MSVFVCRTCLYTSPDIRAFKMVEKVKSVLEIIVPEMKLTFSKAPVCSQCYYFLKNVENFKSKCIEVQKQLLNYNVGYFQSLQPCQEYQGYHANYQQQVEAYNMRQPAEEHLSMKRRQTCAALQKTRELPVEEGITDTANDCARETFQKKTTASVSRVSHPVATNGEGRNSNKSQERLHQTVPQNKEQSRLPQFENMFECFPGKSCNIKSPKKRERLATISLVKQVDKTYSQVPSVLGPDVTIELERPLTDSYRICELDSQMSHEPPQDLSTLSSGLNILQWNTESAQDLNNIFSHSDKAAAPVLSRFDEDSQSLPDVDVFPVVPDPKETVDGSPDEPIEIYDDSEVELNNTSTITEYSGDVQEEDDVFEENKITIVKMETEEENPSFFNKKSDSGYYICKLCSHKYKSSKGLYEHTHQKHTELKFYHCRHCTFFSLWKSALARHMSLFHMEGPIETEVLEFMFCYHCNFRSTFKDVLADHIRRTHFGVSV